MTYVRAALSALVLLFSCRATATDAPVAGSFRAGAYAQDVTPQKFPVIVNGMFEERTATSAHDPLHARCLVLDDGRTKIAIAVVDSCMLPRELIDQAKALASKSTGIPADHILVSATHSHSAPSSMGCLGSDADPDYPRFLIPRIAAGIEQANKNLTPARIGWVTVNDWNDTACRRWVFRPDRMRKDPFGDLTIRANMHPGYQSPDATGPTGPIDPGLSVVSIQTPDGKPLAVLANYSMHYFGSPLLSADYFAVFAEKLGKMLDADDRFVGIMSQGTSGDLYWADYSKPKKENRQIDGYAEGIAKLAADAMRKIEYHTTAPIAMKETKLKLRRRVPDDKRLAWAKDLLAKMKTPKPKTQAEIYAREAIILHDQPERELKLQAIRIGELGIAAIPNEVYALTGLKIKAQSPLAPTFTIELANGAEGYIPPPEQHKLGGYTTWPARTAGLEVQAEPRIAETVLTLLESVAGKPRRAAIEPTGPYAKKILSANPVAYYRMAEMSGPTAADASKRDHAAAYEDGVLFYLEGPPAPGFCGEDHINRCAHFAGGRLATHLNALGNNYSVELWFHSGMGNEMRPVTGYLLSVGKNDDKDAAGDHLGIGGTKNAPGKLFFFNGNKRNQILTGRTTIQPRTWNHVLFVREGDQVAAYLNGQTEPEIAGPADATLPIGAGELFIGGRCDNFANFEGKIDEVAIYDRVLQAQAAAEHFRASGMPAPVATVTPTTGPAIHRPSDPKSPQESMKTIHLREGFDIELVAAEPLTMDPVAFDWAPDGRLWVVEMADYPYGRDNRMKPCGRVRVLEDTDGDGKYDKSTLFLDNINFPNGLIVWKKGVIVTAAPEIFYAEDTDGDGKADVKKILYRGFNEGNPQLRVNGLRWGLDGWLYCANGWSGGKVTSVQTGKTLDLGRRDFRIKPDEGLIELQAGGSEFGRNRDDWGRWFGCDNSHPLWQFVLDEQYTKRNPLFTPPEPRVQLVVPANPKVYPVSTPQKRYHSFEHHGHFTSACSATIYRDDLLFGTGPSEHTFVCEPVHNLVQHNVLNESGVTFTASHDAGEPERDFLAAEDPWFRPVMVRTGPDGAIWVADMYRYMIEHPDWLPAQGKADYERFYRDGEDKGRIYRVFPKGQRPRPIQRLDKLSTAELVAALDTPNGIQRDLAQRLLTWRNDSAAVEPLKQIIGRPSGNPLAQLHALYLLDALHALDADTLARMIRHDVPAMRANAIRLAEPYAKDSWQLVVAAAKLADDPDTKVRLQLAFSLGEWPDPTAGEALGRLAVASRDDPWIAAAVMTSAKPHYAAIASALMHSDTPPTAPIFQNILDMAVALGNRDAQAQLLSRARGQFETLAHWLDTLAQHKTSVAKLSQSNDALADELKRLPVAIDSARRVAADPSADAAFRSAAVALLARDPARAADDLNLLSSLLVPQTPGEVQLAAVKSIGRLSDPSIPDRLMRDWPAHAPALRSAIIDLLLTREPWSLQLAKAIKSNRVAPLDLDVARRQRLLKHSSDRVRELAAKALGSGALAVRDKVIEDYRPVLTMTGDISRGRAVFAKNCATCHRLDNVGNDIGPSLTSVRDWSADMLLTNILDPDRQVKPEFFAYVATLHDGQSLFGLITADTGSSITIKQLDAKEQTVLRSNIKSLQSTGHSLMPMGLEATVNKQEMADLIQYLQHSGSATAAASSN